MAKTESLIVSVSDEVVSFSIAEEVVQSFKLKDVRLVAEYTTAKGAKPHHWYLKVIIDEEQTYEISMYQDNIDDILDSIGNGLGVNIVPMLGSSTDWQSAIHYPAILKGQPLWTITILEPVGLWAKVKAMLKGKPLDFAPTKAAQKIFSNTSQ